MSLRSVGLFGLRDKVAASIERIKTHVEIFKARGVRVVGAFSGGKDSVVIKELARMSGCDVSWFYNQVGIDPPELVSFIREHHGDVERIKPPVPFFAQMQREGWPPLRQQRWCCRLLKEYHGDGLVLIGIRHAESSRRAKRAIFEPCKTSRERWFLSPIIDWTDADVWEFIRAEGLPYCSLYDEGWDRIGCILCPMNSAAKRHAERWPKMARAYVAAFNRLVSLRISKGIRCDFKTGQELYEWWTSRESRTPATDTDQQCFRFDD